MINNNNKTKRGPIYAARSGGIEVASFAVVVHEKFSFNLSPDYLLHFKNLSDKLFHYINNSNDNSSLLLVRFLFILLFIDFNFIFDLFFI